MKKIWQAFKDIVFGMAVIFIPVTIINFMIESTLFLNFVVVLIVLAGCGLIGWMIRDIRTK